MLDRIRLRKQALTLAFLGFGCGAASVAIAADAGLPDQLLKLGRQAQSQGFDADARNFYEQALKLNPANGDAKAALAQLGEVRQVAFRAQQEPPVPAADKDHAQANAEQPRAATLENVSQLEAVRNQQFAAELRSRQQLARDYLNRNNPEAALN